MQTFDHSMISGLFIVCCVKYFWTGKQAGNSRYAVLFERLLFINYYAARCRLEKSKQTLFYTQVMVDCIQDVAHSFTETWIKVKVVSCLSSMSGAQMSRIYWGQRWATFGSPALKVTADKNSSLFNGRFANAIQPSTRLILFTDRESKWISTWVKILR